MLFRSEKVTIDKAKFVVEKLDADSKVVGTETVAVHDAGHTWFTIQPSAALAEETIYRLNLHAGALTDEAGNASVQYLDPCIKTAKVATPMDKATLEVAGVTKDGKTSDVSPSTNLFVKFAALEELSGDAAAVAVTLASPAGQAVSYTVGECTVLHEGLFIASKQALTEGQEYTLTVPKDVFHNTDGKKNAALEFKFTVLSGSGASPSFADYTAAVEGTGLGDAVVSAYVKNATAAPVVETSAQRVPHAGATDVPTTGALLTFTFDQPVGLADTTGLSLMIKDTTWKKVDVALTAVVADATLQVALPELTAGKAYCVEVTVDAVTGAQSKWVGVKCAADQNMFTTLAKKADVVAPTLVAQAPRHGAVSVGGVATFTLYTSKAVTLVSGADLVTVTGLTQALQKVSADQVSVAGSAVTVQLTDAQQAEMQAKTSATNYYVSVAADKLVDQDQNKFAGRPSTAAKPTYTLTVKPKVTVKANLLDEAMVTAGAHNVVRTEDGQTAKFGLPERFTMHLTFDKELAAAQTGSLVFKSKYSAETVTADLSTHSLVVNDGAKGHLYLYLDVTAGNSYMLHATNAAVVDVNGNHWGGCTAGDDGAFTKCLGNTKVVFTTRQLLRFKANAVKIPAANLQGSTVALLGTKFGQTMVLVGGADVKAVVSDAVLNTALNLETNCHVGHGPYSATCTGGPCTGKAGATVTVDGQLVSMPYSSGTRDAAERVVTSPSLGGKFCSGSEGKRAEGVTGVTAQADCICPHIFDAPQLTDANWAEGFQAEVVEIVRASCRERV